MDDTTTREVPLWPAGWPLGADDHSGVSAPALTPYLSAGPGPDRRPAVVVCPGGGYAVLAPHEGEPVARWLNALGLHAFVLRYRVAPHRHPAPLHDAQRALRTVRHHAATWGADPTRVGILGFSAGGHLAATAGTHYDHGDANATEPVGREGCRPDFLVLCYPVIGFDADGHRGSMINLLGEAPAEAVRRSLACDEQVTTDTPPAFIWHTADDAAVPVVNSLKFGTALARCRVAFDLHIYAHGAHGLGLALGHPHAGAWTGACAQWLRNAGILPAAPAGPT